MLEETIFDYENYIQERLRDLDDLDERRFAKEVLWDGLRKVFALTESRYAALENRIYNEIQIPADKYMIATLICERDKFDPINEKFYPVCKEDLIETNRITVFLEADHDMCHLFLQKKVLKAIHKNGHSITFKIEKSRRYFQKIEQVYRLFAYNHIPWNTVHTGYLERFFDLIPVEETKASDITTADITFAYEEFAPFIKAGLIPLWNLSEVVIEGNDFMMPCPDGKYFEHVLNLTHLEDDSAYLLEAKEEILELRYELKKILIKITSETLEELTLWQFTDGIPDQTSTYPYGVLSNKKRGSFAGRYLYSTGNFLQTRLELIRKMKELTGNKELEVLDFQIVEKTKEHVISGDMNYFISNSVFPKEQRKELVFLFKKCGREDFLYVDDIRYVLSQMQMEYLEYKCVGILT